MRILFQVGFYKFLTNSVPAESVGELAEFLASCKAVKVSNHDRQVKCTIEEDAPRLTMEILPDDCLVKESTADLLKESRKLYETISKEYSEAQKKIRTLESDLSALTMMNKKAV